MSFVAPIAGRPRLVAIEWSRSLEDYKSLQYCGPVRGNGTPEAAENVGNQLGQEASKVCLRGQFQKWLAKGQP